MIKIKRILLRDFYLRILLFVLLFFILYLRCGRYLDPDFGWHLKLGELLLREGVPSSDPFSYTMPSFPFIAHEWLIDIFIAYFYRIADYSGLVFLFTFFSLIPFLFQIFAYRIKFILPFVFLEAGTLLSFAGVRPQVFSWLFIFLFSYIFFKPRNWIRYRVFLPIVILLWVNIHGSFALGVILIFLYIFGSSIFNRKIDFLNLVVLVLSIAASGINPYGFRIWDEIRNTFFDSSLRFAISEWLPAFFFPNITFWFYFVFSIICVLRYYRFFDKSFLLVFTILTIFALSSIRHLPLWVIFSFPTIYYAFLQFSKDAEKIKDGTRRFGIAIIGLAVIALVVFAFQTFFVFNTQSFVEESYYPKGAVEFLNKKKYEGNIFSSYNWGGYLIWKMPEKKVFVDGRMPSWRFRTTTSESSCAFCEYQNIMKGSVAFSPQVDKYNISTVLLPALRSGGNNGFLSKIEKRIMAIFNLSSEDAYDSFYNQLQKKGFKVVYNDKVSVIYYRQE